MSTMCGAATHDLVIRREPRYMAAELGRIRAGQPFDVLGNDGRWWYIRCSNLCGFVNARYTRCQAADQPLWTTRITMDGLSMRDRPALDAETLRLLEQDELIAVLGFVVARSGDIWLHAARDGLKGYVSADRTCTLPAAVPVSGAQTVVLRRLLLAARRSQRETGTPVSVSLAQAIVESNWGLSPPSDANNLLHIRATLNVDGSYAWGPIANGYVLAATNERHNGRTVVVQAAFRTYASLIDGVRDHGVFLRADPRFAAAFSYAHDPAKFAAAVAAGGYSSDPFYVDKLLAQIETYRLAQYDR